MEKINGHRRSASWIQFEIGEGPEEFAVTNTRQSIVQIKWFHASKVRRLELGFTNKIFEASCNFSTSIKNACD